MSNQIFSYTNHSKFDEPEIFVSGKNDIVINKDGKQYFDCNSGLWNVNFGYNNSYYANCFNTEIHYYPTHFWSSTNATELASKKICEYFGYSKVFFGQTGSDAVESAIYISKYYNNKPTVLAYKDGYHGANPQARVVDSYTELINEINSQTSAVLIEPLMLAKGVVEFDISVLQQLFKLKELYNFNIIFDETVTGLGRADYSFDWKPDILITSKGLTNGLFPLSAVMVNENIGNYIKKTDRVFSHGYTMSGHPIACQILVKTIDLLKTIENTKDQFLIQLDKYNLDYTNRGLVFGIKVNDGIYIRRELQKEGYLIRQHNDVLLFVPMLTADVNNYISFFEKVARF
jgi:adenosylmethionine-8-amino-7-oxononanoate aminotransferase